METMAAIILAGGGARRLGGALKPSIRIGGTRMLDRVAAALDRADPKIVVGPDSLALPPGTSRVQEDPPGGGPVAGIGAAFENPAVRATGTVAIVAGDLPLLRAEDIDALRAAVHDGADGAVFVDASGRRQWLCGVWRTAALAERLRAFEADHGGLANGSLGALFGPVQFVEIDAGEAPMPPFFDCDTEDDIRQAEEWLAR
jgi:molybdopterin-guanine dinucleotide biosynthesis protein A